MGGDSSHAQVKDWNQWRGNQRDGVVAGTPPVTWPEKPKQVWKIPAGIGHASPVVVDGRVYQQSRIGEQETLTAYDAATGKQVWRDAYDAPYTMSSAATSHGKGPKSTPVVDRGRVYMLGISGTLSALDAATGKVAWRHDFKKEFAKTSPEFGASMAPMIDGELLFAHVGGDKNGALIAFDRATGARRVDLERRRPGVRVAGDRDVRRGSPSHHPDAIARHWALAGRRQAAVADPVHDRLRPEHHYAGRDRRCVDLRRVEQADHGHTPCAGSGRLETATGVAARPRSRCI